MLKRLYRQIRRRFFNYSSVMSKFIKARNRMIKLQEEFEDEAVELHAEAVAIEAQADIAKYEAGRAMDAIDGLNKILG